MQLDPDSCYRALSTHDRRFDGRFFVGVSSTRIYCRPVCTVKIPRRENCHFYPSAAAAEVDGYRPCLRCRPELAPGFASVDASARIAQAAIGMIENGVADEGGIEHLAGRIGVTSRHLRRVFDVEFGVTPVEYAQTQRLLLAKRLLTDTSLPVTEVAYASGFASVRRFNALFQGRYRMAPMHLRRGQAAAPLPAQLVFELTYRPPYDWDAIIDFLGKRAIVGVEQVTPRSYRRAIALSHRGHRHSGTIEVTRMPKKPTLKVALSASLARAVPVVLARVRHAFDLSCDPVVVAAALGDLAANSPGLRVPGAFDGFELAVRAIVGQQISVAGARTLLGRFAGAFGEAIPVQAGDAPSVAFPTAARVAAATPADIIRLGLTKSRAATIVAMAQAVASGDIELHPGVDVEATMDKLQSLRGIGTWTANYIAMRALGWPDAFLASDLIVLRALGETRPARAAERSEAWRPWRAYAVMHLWRQS